MSFTDGKAFGPDVSHWSPVKDWAALAASGATFFGAKAAEGAYTIDPTFAAHRDGFRARPEFALGVWYHFFDVKKDPCVQADLFAHAVGKLAPRERLCLDFESKSYANVDSAVLRAHGLSYLEAFFRELDDIGIAAGTRPLLYTTAEAWAAIGNPTWDRASEIDLWVPRYHNPPMPPTALPEPWRTWNVWQFTDNLTGMHFPVPGCGPCDVNVVAGPNQCDEAHPENG